LKYYLLRRLFLYIIVLFIGSFLVFSIIHLIPGDPINLVVKPFAPKEVRDAVIQRLGLDKPFTVQYSLFLKNAVKGDFGMSLRYNMPVIQVISSRIVPTLQLSVSGFIISYLLAIPLGILAAKYSRTWIDLSSMTFALIGICIPGFWLALMLIITFSVNLPWLPSTGYGGLNHFILPVICMALEGTGMNARMMRSSMLEV
jgi:peptide/nickel transport system permease protein